MKYTMPLLATLCVTWSPVDTFFAVIDDTFRSALYAVSTVTFASADGSHPPLELDEEEPRLADSATGFFTRNVSRPASSYENCVAELCC